MERILVISRRNILFNYLESLVPFFSFFLLNSKSRKGKIQREIHGFGKAREAKERRT